MLCIGSGGLEEELHVSPKAIHGQGIGKGCEGRVVIPLDKLLQILKERLPIRYGHIRDGSWTLDAIVHPHTW